MFGERGVPRVHYSADKGSAGRDVSRLTKTGISGAPAETNLPIEFQGPLLQIPSSVSGQETDASFPLVYPRHEGKRETAPMSSSVYQKGEEVDLPFDAKLDRDLHAAQTTINGLGVYSELSEEARAGFAVREVLNNFYLKFPRKNPERNWIVPDSLRSDIDDALTRLEVDRNKLEEVIATISDSTDGESQARGHIALLGLTRNVLRRLVNEKGYSMSDLII